MRKTTIAIVFVGLVGLILGVTAVACNTDEDADTATELEPIEVREYEGQDLSSINDFRENSIKGPQQVNIDDYRLRITGLVTSPLTLTYGGVLEEYERYKKVITLNCVEGWSATILWEGLLVRDLIEDSEPLENATVVIFHAYDGYTTSLPIDYLFGNDILMASKMNDVVLPAARGFPFQLVAESKWGYKWIRWITEIELSDDTDYRGYWEGKGYSNTGDLSKGFFSD